MSLLVFSDILETFTHYCLKKGALLEESFIISGLSDVFVFLKPIIFSPYLWLAFLSVFLTFVIWSTILSRIDLSVAVPICSFSYLLVPLVSLLFLHEEVTFLDWSGIFCILFGVLFVSSSSKDEELILP